MASLHEKKLRLRSILAGMGEALIGFSGGVDSALLARVAHDVLGERAVAVTAVSPSLPQRELQEAKLVAAEIGIRHVCVETREVEDPRYAANPANRCYFCKAELFTVMERITQELGGRWLCYGENADDIFDYRPGAQAAREWGVRAPLREAGLGKMEVRELARQLGLRVWDKPAYACLSSRFPTGEAITPEKLRQVEAAEDALWELGFRQFRVRHHGEIARIEVDPADMERLLAEGPAVVERLRAVGYRFVTMDLGGYRRGSLNPVTASKGTATANEGRGTAK